jgi:hypothetical protein
MNQRAAARRRSILHEAVNTVLKFAGEVPNTS